jgi:hypothetical protein
MKKLTGFLVVCVCLVALACVKTRSVNLGESLAGARAPVPWQNVAVYRTADQVPGKYQEVALLVSKGDTLWSNEKQMWNSMKRRAGKLGANAVILDAMTEPSAGAKLASVVLLGVGGSRHGKALAIYVLPVEKK